MTRTSSLWSRGLLCVCLICAAVLLISTIQSNGLIRNRRANDESAYYLSTELTNFEFTQSLLDPNSADYKILKFDIDDVLIQAYNESSSSGAIQGHYLGTRDMTFNKGLQTSMQTTLIFSLNSNEINTVVARYIFVDYMQRTSTPFKINASATVMRLTPMPPPTTTPVVFTTESSTPSTVTTETTSSSSTPHFTSPSTSPATTTMAPLPSPTSSQGPRTNGTTSAAVTNHTTPLHNTTGRTTNASSIPVTITADSEKSNMSGSPITIHPGTANHSSAVSASSAFKPTINNQKAANSTATTPYPLVPYWFDSVPGWGIALLVLASLILLFLIILIILLLLRWCCMNEPEAAPRYDPYAHSPYSSHSPAKTPVLKHTGDDVPRTPEKPKGNRTGMYVVNP